MRLVCPNCDAEYEVDASVIPDGGRDVQCSNCGHAWFQLPPEVEAELAAEEALYDAPPPMSSPVDAEPAPLAPSFGLDDQTLSVLKEEAERETKIRKAEAPTMETQAELGLDAPEPSAGIGSAVARRLARMKGITPDAPIAKAKSRREVFPEIEEINSTLRASSERRDGQGADVSEAEPTDTSSKSAFRTGFSVVLLVAVVGIAVYVMAPDLRKQIPGAAALIDSYVEQVNAGRVGLDTSLKSIIGWLKGQV